MKHSPATFTLDGNGRVLRTAASGPVAITPATDHREVLNDSERSRASTNRMRKPSGGRRLDLVMFCRQLGVLLQAGLSVVDALEALALTTQATVTRDVVDGLLIEIRSGKRLSGALAQQPDHFPALFVAVISGAEQTSQLADAFARYSVFAQQQDTIRTKVRTALVYPAFLALLGAAVVIFLLTYVVPKFASIYESIQSGLPWAARLLLLWGQSLQERPLTMAIAGVVLLGVLSAAVVSGQAKRLAFALIQRVPHWAAIQHSLMLARLYRTLSMLVTGGIPITAALEIVRPQLQAPWNRQVDAAKAQLKLGKPLSEALQHADLLSAAARSLLMIGERSGALGPMLDESARFMEIENAVALDRLMRLVEPVIMTVVGVGIGAIVILMYMPIFEIAGTLR